MVTVRSKASVEDEIAHLRDLDLRGLHARWQSVFRRPPPPNLPRHLLFAVLAFRIQADRDGDLDHETRKILDRTNANESGLAMADRLKSLDRKRNGPDAGHRASSGMGPAIASRDGASRRLFLERPEI
jgi:hypothetical protein